MPHYKSLDNAVHFIDSIEFEYLLPSGAVLITDEEAEALRPVAPVVTPPIVVSPRQIRQALTAAGLRTQVESAIATSANQDLKDWWEFSTAFEENHPMVVQMALDLEVTGEQLHSLFELAASL